MLRDLSLVVVIALCAMGFDAGNAHGQQTGNRLRLVSGVLNGQSLTPTNPEVRVQPGLPLRGNIRIHVYNEMHGAAVAPLAVTPTWGDPRRSFWEVSHSIATGDTEHSIDISLTSPAEPGTYYVVIAMAGTYNADQIMSGTHPSQEANWERGNLVARRPATDFEHAIREGWTPFDWYMPAGPASIGMAMTAVRVRVGEGRLEPDEPKKSETQRHQTRNGVPRTSMIVGRYCADWDRTADLQPDLNREEFRKVKESGATVDLELKLDGTWQSIVRNSAEGKQNIRKGAWRLDKDRIIMQLDNREDIILVKDNRLYCLEGDKPKMVMSRMAPPSLLDGTGERYRRWYAGTWDSTIYNRSERPKTVGVRVIVIDSETRTPVRDAHVALTGRYLQQRFGPSKDLNDPSSEAQERECAFEAMTEADGIAVFSLGWKKPYPWYIGKPEPDVNAQGVATYDGKSWTAPVDDIEQVQRIELRHSRYQYAEVPFNFQHLLDFGQKPRSDMQEPRTFEAFRTAWEQEIRRPEVLYCVLSLGKGFSDFQNPNCAQPEFFERLRRKDYGAVYKEPRNWFSKGDPPQSDCGPYFVYPIEIGLTRLSGQGSEVVRIERSDEERHDRDGNKVAESDSRRQSEEQARLETDRKAEADRQAQASIDREHEDQERQVSEKANRNPLGVAVETLTSDSRSRLGLYPGVTGVVVLYVAPGSVADKAGVRTGIVIESVEDRLVEDEPQFNEKIKAKKAGDQFIVGFWRKGAEDKWERDKKIIGIAQLTNARNDTASRESRIDPQTISQPSDNNRRSPTDHSSEGHHDPTQKRAEASIALPRGTVEQAGQFEGPMPTSCSGVRWRFQAPSSLIGAPVVVGDTLICGCYNGEIIILDAQTGTPTWRGAFKGRLMSSASYCNGLVFWYFIDYDDRHVSYQVRGGLGQGIVAWDLKSRAVRWTHRTVGELAVYYPTITFYRTSAIVPMTDGVAYAFDVNTGKPVWTFKAANTGSVTTAAISGDTVYVSLDDRYAIDARTGAGKWKARGFMTYSSGYAVSGQWLVASESHRASCDNAQDGKELWGKDFDPSYVGPSPTLTKNRAYFVAGQELVCLDIATGNVQWRLPLTAENLKDTCSVIIGNVLVVFSKAGLCLGVAINATGGEVLWKVNVGPDLGTANNWKGGLDSDFAIYNSGMIYLSTRGGLICSLATSEVASKGVGIRKE